MQLKTIRKNIEKKLNEWLSSITDKDLAKAIKDNVLVSGGSITSMLLNETINDYDIYIKDRGVLLALVKYYVGSHQVLVLDGRDKKKLVSDLEADYKGFFEILKNDTGREATIEDINNAYAISLRNLKEDQVKLFLPHKNGGMRIEYSQESPPAYRPVFLSPNAISLSDQVQIVIRFHGNAEAIHSTFDFIHATNYFTFESGLVTNKRALESIITKQLMYQGSQYPVTSIIRMRKFIKKNWNIGAGEILKILFQVSELDLKNPDVLEEQLIGVDVAYFDCLISILRNVDPGKFTSAYLNTIIDKVFDSQIDAED